MSITATELKMNLSKYLLLSATEDIYITKKRKSHFEIDKSFSGTCRYSKVTFWYFAS